MTHSIVITQEQRRWLEERSIGANLIGAVEVPGGFRIELDDEVYGILSARGHGDALAGLQATIDAGSARLQ